MARLFLQQLIKDSIDFLQELCPVDGYFLAFSGGKDSIVMKQITKDSGVKFDAHYSITSADPPELVAFIKQYHPEVSMDYPGTTMWKLIPNKLMPPTRLVRYCCQVLKEGGGENRIVLLGNKKTDSRKRNNQEKIRVCSKNGKVTLAPLYNWNDEDIWEYIKYRNLPYCSLYDEGYKRLGCIGCPMAGAKQMHREFERWPKYKQAYLRAFGRMLEERKKKNKPTEWQTPEEAMEWWLT